MNCKATLVLLHTLVHFFVQFVQLEMLGLLVEDPVDLVKVMLKCASTISGAQSVAMGGIVLMQVLFVISLGFQDSVSEIDDYLLFS